VGEVEVQHRRFELGVAHPALDQTGVDTSLQQMRRVAVAQRADGDSTFVDAGRGLGFAEGVLDRADGHGFRSSRAAIAAPAQGREQQRRVSVRAPVAAQQWKGIVG
jgi:hypothetical protein